MAKLSGCAFLGIFILITGCQTARQTSSTDDLPGPNFAGPVIEAGSPPVITYNPPEKVVAPRVVTKASVPAAWIPVARAEKRQWRWIVIHHSATPTGGAAAFGKAHKAKGWDELGYHFVIGNGTDTGDGQVEVGSRWPVQKHGAHAKTPDNEYNDHGIGICLVGNFENTRPTAKQIASLTRLVSYLADTYHVKQADILGHKTTGKQTECPGRYMDVAAIRSAVARQRVAISDDLEPTLEAATDGELMQTASR